MFFQCCVLCILIIPAIKSENTSDTSIFNSLSIFDRTNKGSPVYAQAAPKRMKWPFSALFNLFLMGCAVFKGGSDNHAHSEVGERKRYLISPTGGFKHSFIPPVCSQRRVKEKHDPVTGVRWIKFYLLPQWRISEALTAQMQPGLFNFLFYIFQSLSKSAASSWNFKQIHYVLAEEKTNNKFSLILPTVWWRWKVGAHKAPL